jgi:hypothetical protein
MSITRRRLANGPGGLARFHFLGQWRDGQGVQRSRTFADLEQAAAYDAAVKAGQHVHAV